MTVRLVALLALALSICLPNTRVSAAELIMFEAPGCSWCATWDAEIGHIYHLTDEGKIAPLRRVDLSAPRPEDLRDVRGIVHTPTFVLLHDGREVGRIRGYPGEDFFWGMLGELLSRIAR